MREDILALLEEGPQDGATLVRYLSPKRKLRAVLRELTREGLVTRVGDAKQWALVPIGNVSPAIVSPTAPIVSAKSTSVPADEDADDELLTDEELLEDQDDAVADAIDEIAHEADVAPERRARRARPYLRQQPAPPTTVKRDAEPAWWCTASPDGFTARAGRELERMAQSKEGQNTRWHPIKDSER